VVSTHGLSPVNHGASGNPFTEQRDFLQGIALLDASAQVAVRVSGADRLSWLNSLISQDVLVLEPGTTREGLILDPKGHVEHAFLLTDDGEWAWLLTHRSHRETLIAWLNSMRFRMDVEVSAEPEGSLLVASWGPHSSAGEKIRHQLGDPMVIWEDPWPRIEPGSIGYGPEPHPGAEWALRYELFSPQQGDPAAFARGSLGLREGAVMDALAIASGRPMLADIDDKALPHEFDWLRTAVHLNKGCYRGQETVAKVHNLGHPPRRFVLLHCDGSQSVLPQKGNVLRFEGRDVGVVTRAAWHWELGPVALALVKRTVDPSATLSIITDEGEVSANQEILVSPDAGASRRVPRIPRLGSASA